MSASIMPESLAAKRALVAALCRPLLMPLRTDGVPTPLPLPDNFQFAELPNAPGFTLARLLAPPEYSATLLKGDAGAYSPRFAVPQAVRVEVLHGELLWWQESQGEAQRLLGRGEVVDLLPGEAHSYRAHGPCLTYNLFTPALPDA